MSYANLKLFALSSNQELAKKIAKNMGLDLGKCSVKTFSDGEIQINIEESVRGSHVFLIQSSSSPVNENLMELLIMVDALRRASVVTINLHASQIQGFFDIPVDHLMGAPLIADYFERIGLTGENGDVVVVSPDHGGVTRARKLADFLKTPIAIIDKRRPRANVAEIMNIIGDVKGKKCVLIDDMIDTAGTITLAANALKALGATDIYASCTHGVLSGPALERIESSSITKLVVTDTIELPQSIRESEKITEISISALIADAIIRIHENRPLSPLFQMRVKSEDLV